MYQIRFHGRGGQGMKTASRMLGTAFFLEGFEVQDAPRYGAERRGAPIFAYVRAARTPINERGVVRRPDLVIVADDSLVGVPAAGVMQGVHEQTVLLINSHETAATWQQRLNACCRVLVLPATEEVEDRAELPYVGAACAGAAACLVGAIGREALQRAIADELGHLGEVVVSANLARADSAFEAMQAQAGLVKEGPPPAAAGYQPPDWVDLPFEDARAAAPSIHAAATSVEVRTGLWRTLRPVIDFARCSGCWWVCSTYCPDGAIKVTADQLPDIDYDHCKGCMVCVAVCPPHAIEAVPEHLAQAEAAKEEKI
jgi:pyruvate ferredoxin oxidoreductase gamma subunit